MGDRRYDDAEAAAIFRAAAEGPALSGPAAAGAARGLTLAELQAIGGEVGISADAVARAALALDVQRAGSHATLLGFPIGVSRVVELPRRLTDEEWERLVVRFREVFDARGSMRADGTLREWRNGNLHVLLEPTEKSYRLRFRTINGGSQALVGGGIMTMGIAAAVAVATALSGTLGHAVPAIGLLAMVGAAWIATGVLRLPRWARIRGRQMEALALEAALRPALSLPRNEADPSPS
jgi:hypothetical protein